MKNQNIVFTRIVPKMSKARLFRSVLALGIVALIMQVSLPRAQAYDLSSLNGSYADFFSGFHPVGEGPRGTTPHPMPINAIGAIIRGGLVYVRWRRRPHDTSGLQLQWRLLVGDGWDLNLPGTYTVNADGTGTMTLAGIRRRHFVIGAGGNELKYIGTDPDRRHVTGGSMVKQ